MTIHLFMYALHNGAIAMADISNIAIEIRYDQPDPTVWTQMPVKQHCARPLPWLQQVLRLVKFLLYTYPIVDRNKGIHTAFRVKTGKSVTTYIISRY